MLWSLVVAFFKIGLMSFGGGYAMIPVIEHEVSLHQWLNHEEFVDAVALAGMAPGPIATNTATIVGYKTAGLPGAIAATFGMIVPSLLLIILIAAFFTKIYSKQWVVSSFYGLRPVVTGLIIYAAVHFGFSDNVSNLFTWETAFTAGMIAAVVIAILRYRMHPLNVILWSGLVGVAVYY